MPVLFLFFVINVLVCRGGWVIQFTVEHSINVQIYVESSVVRTKSIVKRENPGANNSICNLLRAENEVYLLHPGAVGVDLLIRKSDRVDINQTASCRQLTDTRICFCGRFVSVEAKKRIELPSTCFVLMNDLRSAKKALLGLASRFISTSIAFC